MFYQDKESSSNKTRYDRFSANYRKERTSAEILSLSVVVADKGYDSEEDNHAFVRESLHAFSVIPARYEHVPIWRTHGRYRKQQMKRGYSLQNTVLSKKQR